MYRWQASAVSAAREPSPTQEVAAQSLQPGPSGIEVNLNNVLLATTREMLQVYIKSDKYLLM